MHNVSEMALVKGMEDTKLTLARWQAKPVPVLKSWLAGALGISVVLLLVVWALSLRDTPDISGVSFPGLTSRGTIHDSVHIFARNLLVLALHGFACVAGFIAGSSLPEQAAQHRGLWRWVHEKAGKGAILFVTGATLFSLTTQALILGQGAATLAHQGNMGPGLLLLGILPHAIPELLALFLPLAAWIIASRRGEWHELLAATVVTVGLAVPTLFIAALLEVFVSPHLILWLRG